MTSGGEAALMLKAPVPAPPRPLLREGSAGERGPLGPLAEVAPRGFWLWVEERDEVPGAWRGAGGGPW